MDELHVADGRALGPKSGRMARLVPVLPSRRLWVTLRAAEMAPLSRRGQSSSLLPVQAAPVVVVVWGMHAWGVRGRPFL